jgi:hypothetical protein
MLTNFLAAPFGSLAIAILIALATAQMYWALGGQVGLALAHPAPGKGVAARPSATVSILVATLLVVAADLMLVRVGVFTTKISPDGVRIACGVLAAGFLIRAIGDFRQVGFFKRAAKSSFARLDSRVYSPVCLFLAVAIGVHTL